MRSVHEDSGLRVWGLGFESQGLKSLDPLGQSLRFRV